MAQTAVEAIGRLRAVMEGPVIEPSDSGFDDGRRVWNGGIDRRPAVIARCGSAADVAAAVTYAREHGLEVSVRGGAHNPAGTAVCDGGLMIDLSLLNQVAVDPSTARTARPATTRQRSAAGAHGLGRTRR
jgi:FAD/FMN-containing dehydrogenase